MGKYKNISWHSLPIKEVMSELSTYDEGLINGEVKKRLKKFGPNEIESFKRKSVFQIFFSQLASPLIYILLIAAIVTYFLEYKIDAYVILIIVICNALIGLFHELKADKAMEALSKIMSPTAKVYRNGELNSILSRDLVPGDLVEIEEGMKIPADIRLMEVEGLQIDESILTGEAVPQEKNLDFLAKYTSLAECKNMVFSGTIAVLGRGKGYVVSTGKNTEFNQIAREINETDKLQTPLQNKLDIFSKKIAYTALIIIVGIIIIGIYKDVDLIQTFLIGLSVAVAVIPEGLPAVISIALATGAYKMYKNNAIVRRLVAVETLGSVTVIASDKTGTLTENQMTVSQIYFYKEDKVYNVTGTGYGPHGEIEPNPSDNLKKMLACAALANSAEIFKEKNNWFVKGDPTEGSLVTLATKAGLSKEILENKLVLIDKKIFNSELGYSISLRKSGDKNILTIVGKVENILNKTNLESSHKKKIIKKMEEFAGSSLRVIGVAIKSLPSSVKEIELNEIENMNFLGFVGMSDMPRPEALEAIRLCKIAGIRPIMITGDFSVTAKSIAYDLKIIDNLDSEVLTGEDIDRLTDKELKTALKTCSVYARVTPEHKLRIVENLQKSGEVVAMTGDGINDAPALKKSQIGVAMGEGGTDVSREVSDLVLKDNNFATIVTAVSEGRTVYKNIRRAILYLLSTNVGELLIIMFAMIFISGEYSIVLLPVQILWLNLVTDGTAGLALAMEPNHEDTLEKSPRSPKENIIDKVMFGRIVLVSFIMIIVTMIIYFAEINAGASLDRARTMAFMVMIVMQIFNVLNCRSFEKSILNMLKVPNLYVIGSIIISFALSYLTVTLPVFRTFFRTVPLNIEDWGKIVLISLSIIIVVEIEKIVGRLKERKDKKIKRPRDLET